MKKVALKSQISGTLKELKKLKKKNHFNEPKDMNENEENHKWNFSCKQTLSGGDKKPFGCCRRHLLNACHSKLVYGCFARKRHCLRKLFSDGIFWCVSCALTLSSVTVYNQAMDTVHGTQ